MARENRGSQEVAGSIPDGVNGNFQFTESFGSVMDLGSTQPLREMSTRDGS
jgi:hypothetical protein